MAEYYLRLEAVNIATFVYDTDRVPVARGGSLLLLEAPRLVATHFAGHLRPIATGASQGVFAFDAFDDAAAALVRAKVDAFLRGHGALPGDMQRQALRHATFAVSVTPKEGSDYAAETERLIALNRWRQMQAPSVAVPSDDGPEPCAWDRLRPGRHRFWDDERGQWRYRSEATHLRREHGRGLARTNFYTHETTTPSEPGLTGLAFVQDLEQLARGGPSEALEGKMAVIYIDGNKFGEHKKRVCRTPENHTEFSQKLTERRRQLLRALLDRARRCAAFKHGDEIRLETLLWGGDEIIWVVPAWLGWWTLQFFYEQTGSWTLPLEPGTRLTHAAGVVFCHYNAPIHRITQLARELAELAKEADSTRSLFAYEVLESFDHLGRDLREHRARRAVTGVESRHLLLEGTRMREIWSSIRALDADERLSASRLHLIVQALRNPERAEGRRNFRSLQEALGERIPDKTIRDLSSLLGNERACWLHVADLWDYVVHAEAADV